jgi:hypothetical protein
MYQRIMKYMGDNADLIIKEGKVLLPLVKLQRVFPVIIILLFLIGAYITYNTPSKATLPEGFINIEPDANVSRKLRHNSVATTATTATDGGEIETPTTTTTTTTEGFDIANATAAVTDAATNTSRCPNILIQHGSEIFLYNSKVEKVPGVNPIRFNSLEDYSEFIEWLHGRGIRCPVLFLQYSYDAQGNPVYKMRPSPTDLQGGLSPNVPYSPAPAALVQMMDASRDNPPFNNQMYDGFDPLNFNMGDYTSQDAAFRAKELSMKYSDNPMDSNWGGIKYSESAVASGAYIDRTRPDAIRSDTSAMVPMRVPAANEKYRNPMYAGDAVSRGRGADVEWGKARRPAA